jgi:hypothetical protein
MATKKDEKKDQPGVTEGGREVGGSAFDPRKTAMYDQEHDIQRVEDAKRQGLEPGGSAAEITPIPPDVPNPKRDPGGSAPVQDAKAGEGADAYSAQAATRPSGSGAGVSGRQQEGPGTLGQFPLIGGFPADEREAHYRVAQEEQGAAYADLQGRGSPHLKPGQPAPVAVPTAEGGGPAGTGSGPLGGG